MPLFSTSADSSVGREEDSQMGDPGSNTSATVFFFFPNFPLIIHYDNMSSNIPSPDVHWSTFDVLWSTLKYSVFGLFVLTLSSFYPLTDTTKNLGDKYPIMLIIED